MECVIVLHSSVYYWDVLFEYYDLEGKALNGAHKVDPRVHTGIFPVQERILYASRGVKWANYENRMSLSSCRVHTGFLLPDLWLVYKLHAPCCYQSERRRFNSSSQSDETQTVHATSLACNRVRLKKKRFRGCNNWSYCSATRDQS